MGKSKELATLTDAGGTLSGNLTFDSTSPSIVLGADNNQRSYIQRYADDLYIYNKEAAGDVYLGSANTTRMTIDASGRVTMPYQPHCFCRGYNGRTGSNVIVYDTVETNNGNHFNNSTGLFTAPVSGMYYVGIFSGYKNENNYLGIGLVLNGSVDVYGWSANISGLNHANNTVNYVRYLTAGDTVGGYEFAGYTTIATDTHYSCFSVSLIG